MSWLPKDLLGSAHHINLINQPVPMLYFTQLIYLKPGQEEVFDQFEAVAIPLIPKYRGQLLFRLRPSESDFISAEVEKPYEIHFGCFDGEEDFLEFAKDEERKKFLHLKEQSIRATVLITGAKR